jgi:TonB family protein
MMPLETWVETPLAGALGWALLHSLWEGALIAAALAAVLMATRSPRVRYAAASIALLLMLAGFGITLVRMMPEGTHAVHAARPFVFPPWRVAPEADVPGAAISGLAALVPWLAPLWIAGVWVFYLRQIAGWVSVCRLRRRGVCSAPERWQQELTRLSARLRVSRPIALLESCMADAPMVLGHFRPLILVPVGVLAGLPAEQVKAILLHELAHIRRCDYLVNVLQRGVEGLLFYHPAVWWISRVIRTERENCCDDVVVGVSGNAHEYAVALAALEQKRWSGCEPAVAATGGSLVKRIRRLLYPKGPSGAWTLLVACAVFLVTAAAALSAWPAQGNSASSAAQVSDTETSRYDKWLNEDVVYIISDAERGAFLKLTTDEEREHFIEQFWQRRNPTPGAHENPFKEEHYRRIAYANEHFATGVPGWKTDRGHVYIIYGPPDEIESHPIAGQGTTVPREEWLYRHIERVGNDIVFRFTDPLLNGEYRLFNPLQSPKSSPENQTAQVPGRVRVGAKVQEQNLITKVDPIYPPLAMLSRIQGVVRLTVVIDKDGRVSNMELVNGHPLLVAAAKDAVRQWVYRPTLLNGEPVEVVTQVDVNFLLSEK